MSSKLLLVEPDMVYARSIETYVRKNGFAVEWCSSAQEAIFATESFRPDIIVTELLLAGHNGIDFLYELRSYQDWQDMPVLLFSTIAERDIDLSALHQTLGVTAYLYKPTTTLADLVQMVNRYIPLHA